MDLAERGARPWARTQQRKKMKLKSEHFRVRPGKEVNLRKWPTQAEPVYKSKQQYQELLAEHVAQLSSPAAT
jgi:hypothetical protein